MKRIDLRSISIKDATFSILDFETTGLSAINERVIEVGLIKIKNFKIIDSYQTLINPERSIPSEITKLTGITNLDVKKAPRFSVVAEEISNLIEDTILVAHNFNFDYSFLKSEFNLIEKPLPYFAKLCTVKLSRKLYPDIPSRSLGNLARHLRIRQKNLHRALSDATTTAKILLKLLTTLSEDYNIYKIEDLLNFQEMPKNKKSLYIKKGLVKNYVALPETPGVYFFNKSEDYVIYIGKAKSLKQRVKNYFSDSSPKKAKKIVRSADHLNFIETNSELTALIAEAELIKIHNPNFNRLLKKFTEPYFIKINPSENFPLIQTSSKFEFDGCDYFGPYNNRDIVRQLTEIINKTFCLRECSNKVLAKKKKCYLSEIERCLAPCVEKNITDRYKKELEKVYTFLSGNNQDALNRLLDKMKLLSVEQKYEEAGIIRNTIQLLLNQLNKSSILAEPINTANVLIEINDTDKRDFILFREGRVYIKDFPIEKKNNFDDAVEEYFENTISFNNQINLKDLEKIKITLSWLVKNREKTKLYYLKDYESKQELFLNLGISRKPTKAYKVNIRLAQK